MPHGVLILLLLMGFHGQLTGTGCPVSPGGFKENPPVEAVNGSDVILPCLPEFTVRVDHDRLEWSRGNEDIYTIRGGYSDGLYKHSGRASVSREEFQKRNASLKLFRVSEADGGEYCCCLHLDSPDERKCIKLILVLKKKGGDSNDHMDVTGRSGIIQATANVQSNTTKSSDTDTNEVWKIAAGVIVAVLVLVLFVLLMKKKCAKRFCLSQVFLSLRRLSQSLNRVRRSAAAAEPANEAELENLK
ncbi:uncharacterized protein LOC108901683 isoform X3 [Lates calcarifer]|uniref:Uncharacterized protein LOC108901683 isoform X3 n=1 Tax=Lates calcarifer TaxID=8187 RepID=A0AAJ7VKR5_LATCA|nr:uncharacterized protein LOC108901683 isoform X3 [Lates calcarifer]